MVEIIISIKKLKTEIPPLPLLAQGCNHQVGKGQVWEEVDGLAYLYVWHCLVSF